MKHMCLKSLKFNAVADNNKIYIFHNHSQLCAYWDLHNLCHYVINMVLSLGMADICAGNVQIFTKLNYHISI